MSVRLAQLTIKNFRSCRFVKVPLSDVTPIVGFNNAGKSNILAAVKWVLRPQRLLQSDFLDPRRAVSISATISGLTPDVLNSLSERHRARIAPFCPNAIIAIRRTQEEPDSPSSSILLEVRDGSTEQSEWTRNPTGIEQAIQGIFPEPIEIGAMQDAAEDSTKNKAGTTISRLLKEIIPLLGPQEDDRISEELEGLIQRYDAAGRSRPQVLRDFDNQLSNLIGNTFPGIELKLHIPLPTLSDIFKRATIAAFDQGSQRPVASLGHGAQRSIQISLLRYLAEHYHPGTTISRRKILIIEEPELYLHPQAISTLRKAITELAGGDFQVIYATHSPNMISASALKDTLLVDCLRGAITMTNAA